MSNQGDAARGAGEHTPGPWEVTRALKPSDGGWDYGISIVIDGRRRCIAEAFEVVGSTIDGEPTRVPAEANARLMGAAPDMLAVLKRAIAKNTDVEGSAWWGEVFAAVAKAEGRQP